MADLHGLDPLGLRKQEAQRGLAAGGELAGLHEAAAGEYQTEVIGAALKKMLAFAGAGALFLHEG